MMNRFVSIGLWCVCGVWLLSSCAKEEELSDQELQRRSFDAWMSLYGDGAERQESGIYIKKLRSTTNPDAKQLDPESTTQWARINYTGRALLTGDASQLYDPAEVTYHDVYLSRDPEIAKQQGRFEAYVRYNPDYVAMTGPTTLAFSSSYYYYTTPGNYLALMEMKEGDLWRVYIPSDLAYSSNGFTNSASSYGGQKSLAANTPVIVDLELVEVVKDAASAQKTETQLYAMNNLGLAFSDTIGPIIYYKRLGTIDPDGEEIATDSTVQFYYVGRFMDGFVFDTNIKDTAEKYNLAQYHSKLDFETPLSVKVGTPLEDGGVVPGLDSALRNMYYGEYGETIFTSESCYGNAGQFSTSATVIPPYTPVIFQVFTSPLYGAGTYDFPYSIEAIQQSTTDEKNVWVIGFAVGFVYGDDVSESELTLYPEHEVYDNIMFANTSLQLNYTSAIPVALNTQFQQDELNWTDNRNSIYQVPIKICGDIGDYKGTRGIVNITAFKKLW